MDELPGLEDLIINDTQLSPECNTTQQIIIFNPTDQTQHNIGKHLYQKNNALRNFANVMEHPEFSTFINEYLFRDPAAVIKLMKLYADIGQTIKDPYEKLAVFNARMRDYMRSGKPAGYSIASNCPTSSFTMS